MVVSFSTNIILGYIPVRSAGYGLVTDFVRETEGIEVRVEQVELDHDGLAREIRHLAAVHEVDHAVDLVAEELDAPYAASRLVADSHEHPPARGRGEIHKHFRAGEH